MESNNLESDLLKNSKKEDLDLTPPRPLPLKTHDSKFRKRRIVLPVLLSLSAAGVPGTVALGTVAVAGGLSLPSVWRSLTRRL